MPVFKKIILNVLLLLFVSNVIVPAMEVNGHLDILQNIFFNFPQDVSLHIVVY